MSVLGLLLAAGAGRRMGTPKGLLRDPAGVPFVERAVRVLRDGGCDQVVVVVGAAAEEVAALVPDGAIVVTAADWADGMGASLRRGLCAAQASDAGCALVTLVDLPDVDAAVVRRILDAAGGDPDVLARAAYHGVPGHPVLIGRTHWDGVLGVASGDRGARDYLTANPPALVECGDLASGRDVDRPGDLAPPGSPGRARRPG